MYKILPSELVNYIYEFDPTYRDIFQKSLNQINKRTQIYMFQGVSMVYYLYDKDSQCLHMCNSIKIPSYVCTSFGINEEQMDIIIKTHHLKHLFEKRVEFDIEAQVFKDFYF